MNQIFFISLLFILSSCSIKSREDQKDIRNLFSKGEYEKALSSLEESDLKKDQQNQLLYLMEKGRILYKEKSFFAASQIFIQANELVDKLYTKSIKEEIISSLGNDNSKTYYGSIYERSMLYYYQALSYFKLYEEGRFQEKIEVINDKKEKSIEVKWTELSNAERQKYLYSARASLLAWDTFFKEINRSSRIKTLYRHDLMGKILAGNIHEVVGKRSELNISLQLYKDALQVLEQQGLIYKTYNEEFKNYTKEVENYISNKSKIDTKFIKSTNHYQNLKDYLHYKILSLTKKIRSGELSRSIKLYKPSDSVLAKIKGNFPNITIVLEKGLVAPMEAEDFSFTLKSAIAGIKNPTTRSMVNGIGVPIITYFAMGPLGLGFASHSGNTTIYTGHGIGEVITKEAGIEFEMPMVKESEVPDQYYLQVESNKENKKVEISKTKLNIMGPLSDIALLAANERAGNSYKKLGTKIAIKHLIAILAAYKTYTSIKQNSGELFAKPAAFAQYMITAKGIKETEKADIRHWTTLPSDIFIDEINLKNGKYTLNLIKKIKGTETEELVKVLGELDINSQEKQVFTYSLN